MWWKVLSNKSSWFKQMLSKSPWLYFHPWFFVLSNLWMLSFYFVITFGFVTTCIHHLDVSSIWIILCILIFQSLSPGDNRLARNNNFCTIIGIFISSGKVRNSILRRRICCCIIKVPEKLILLKKLIKVNSFNNFYKFEKDIFKKISEKIPQ